MPTRSIHQSDAEAQGLEQLREATGTSEDVLLEQAVLRGLQEMRFEAGIRAFEAGRESSEAAEIAGLPRAVFLHEMGERGVTILEGPSTLAEELADLAGCEATNGWLLSHASWQPTSSDRGQRPVSHDVHDA